MPLIDVMGAWTRNSSADVQVFTQSTRTASGEFGNGGISGGLDDRFDLWFMNANVFSGTQNINYVNNSYQVLGSVGVLNDGAQEGTQALGTQVHQMSDHYPVLMQLQITFPDACPDCSPEIGTLSTD